MADIQRYGDENKIKRDEERDEAMNWETNIQKETETERQGGESRNGDIVGRRKMKSEL